MTANVTKTKTPQPSHPMALADIWSDFFFFSFLSQEKLIFHIKWSHGRNWTNLMRKAQGETVPLGKEAAQGLKRVLEFR